MTVLVVGTIALAALGTALALLLRNMGPAGHSLPVTAEWIGTLSVDRYLPMMHLLDDRDMYFLRSQPGYTPRMESNLRAQRSQIFAGYLRCLTTDFRRVCAALKLVMVQSQQDRPELAALLVRQECMFAAAMILVRVRLFLYGHGLSSVDVSSLLENFDALRTELRSMMPSPVLASA